MSDRLDDDDGGVRVLSLEESQQGQSVKAYRVKRNVLSLFLLSLSRKRKRSRRWRWRSFQSLGEVNTPTKELEQLSKQEQGQRKRKGWRLLPPHAFIFLAKTNILNLTDQIMVEYFVTLLSHSSNISRSLSYVSRANNIW